MADRVRELRRRRGMTQEELAEATGLSVGSIRKLEQGGNVRMETLHAIARALGVVTVTFVAPASPEPQEEAPDDYVLSEMRSVILPPTGLDGREIHAWADGDHPDLERLRKTVAAIAAAYHSDRYDDLATFIPALLRSAHYHVETSGRDDQKRDALGARAHILSIACRYLIQIRAHDLAMAAAHRLLQDALQISDILLATASISSQAHVLLCQARFGDAERLSADMASEIEPQMSTAEPDELSAWGWMNLRASAAAARNNRPDEAKEFLKLAATGAARLGREHPTTTYSNFGPVTVAIKRVENAMIAGHPDQALTIVKRLPGDLDQTAPGDWQRHRLDHALALIRTRRSDQATDVLDDLCARAPHWLRYQQYGRDVVRELLQSRPRTLTERRRALAEFMKIPA